MQRSFWLVLFWFSGCQNSNRNVPVFAAKPVPEAMYSYEEVKANIKARQIQLAQKYPVITDEVPELTDFWVETVGNTLYKRWENTPWDFNGTTAKPNDGKIACGFFVTTLLRDMNVKLNRTKLSVCASSLMMRSLCPGQRIMNLSSLGYSDFNDKLKRSGKGVYIIGLDFHTGLIVNDGKENWFIHSNYINRKGVTREPVLSSAALQSSKTRWVISLTKDKGFIQRWLKA